MIYLQIIRGDAFVCMSVYCVQYTMKLYPETVPNDFERYDENENCSSQFQNISNSTEPNLKCHISVRFVCTHLLNVQCTYDVFVYGVRGGVFRLLLRQ